MTSLAHRRSHRCFFPSWPGRRGRKPCLPGQVSRNFVHGPVSLYAQLVGDAVTKLGNKVTSKSANRGRKPHGDVTDIRISVGENRLG